MLLGFDGLMRHQGCANGAWPTFGRAIEPKGVAPIPRAGLVLGWMHKPAALIASRRVGRGGLVATTFRLVGEDPGVGPVAEALLDACLREAAARPVSAPVAAAAAFA